MAQPTVFIGYDRQDEALKDQLVSHLEVLQKQGLIELWSDHRILPGVNEEAAIDGAIRRAKVAILLISQYSLTSNFILDRVKSRILERQYFQELIFMPIIARPCAWKHVDWLNGIGVRPRDGKPIWGSDIRETDESLVAIANEVIDIINDDLDMDFSSPVVVNPNLRANSNTWYRHHVFLSYHASSNNHLDKWVERLFSDTFTDYLRQHLGHSDLSIFRHKSEHSSRHLADQVRSELSRSCCLVAMCGPSYFDSPEYVSTLAVMFHRANQLGCNSEKLIIPIKLFGVGLLPDYINNMYPYDCSNLIIYRDC